MTLIALILSLSVAAFGILGEISPARLLDVVRWFEGVTGLYAAAAFRIALGLALIYAGPTSHFPGLIRILGIMILMAGFLLPFIGQKRFRRIVSWWCSQDPSVIRVWAGFSLLFGLLLSYSVVT